MTDSEDDFFEPARDRKRAKTEEAPPEPYQDIFGYKHKTKRRIKSARRADKKFDLKTFSWEERTFQQNAYHCHKCDSAYHSFAALQDHVKRSEGACSPDIRVACEAMMTLGSEVDVAGHKKMKTAERKKFWKEIRVHTITKAVKRIVALSRDGVRTNGGSGSDQKREQDEARLQNAFLNGVSRGNVKVEAAKGNRVRLSCLLCVEVGKQFCYESTWGNALPHFCAIHFCGPNCGTAGVSRLSEAARRSATAKTLRGLFPNGVPDDREWRPAPPW